MFSNLKKMNKSKQNPKKAITSGSILILGISLIFIFIVGVFAYQYTEYRNIEKKLETNYSLPLEYNNENETLYRLLNEADILFRMFTLDFEDSSFILYKAKLDSINNYLDSLSSLHIEENPLNNSLSDFDLRNRYAKEFAVLKKNMDDLILSNGGDTNPFKEISPSTTKQINRSDSIITQLSQDVASAAHQDTIIRKRESLFNRIFKAKSDTIIVNTPQNDAANGEQLEIIKTEVSTALINNDRQYRSGLNSIRSTFSQLQEKERQLIFLNFELLDQLHSGINNLRLIDVNMIREIESRDFSRFRTSSSIFRTQLMIVIPLMLILILLLIYYQKRIKLREHQLIEEVKYSNRLVEEKTNILAGISHEIRTPLNALLNITEMLNKQEKEMGNKERIELTESAYYNITTVNNAVNDVLTISRLEQGNDIREFSEVTYFSPVELIEKLIDLHKNQAKLKQITVESNTEIHEELLTYSNKFKISQILSNLIGNAIKYTKTDGLIQISSKMVKSKNQKSLHIEIRDNGIGIDEKHLSQIFRKYYTANPTTGFGLGLYIAKTIADELGADLSVRSKLESGTNFILIVPIFQTKTESKREIEVEKEVYDDQSYLKNLRILIVDDNPINLLYIKQLLKKSNAKVYEAPDGEQAIKTLSENTIDAIITDIHLPDLSGWDLLKHVRTQKELQHIPIFSTTASIDQPEFIYGFSFDGSLPKPFNEMDVITLLNKHFKNKKGN